MRMSKAFVKEDSDQPEIPMGVRGTPLPAGAKNYMTPEGAEKLQEELKYLLDKERPKVVETVSWAAGSSIGASFSLC